MACGFHFPWLGNPTTYAVFPQVVPVLMPQNARKVFLAAKSAVQQTTARSVMGDGLRMFIPGAGSQNIRRHVLNQILASTRPFAVGFVSQNSDICPIPFKPAPKDAGAPPASFEPVCRCARHLAEFRDTNPTANALSEPAQNRHREYSIWYSLTPRVLNKICCYQIIMKSDAPNLFVHYV